jgi:hypothetical protein
LKPRPWGDYCPTKLTPGMGEEEPRKIGAQGYGKEGESPWLDW